MSTRHLISRVIPGVMSLALCCAPAAFAATGSASGDTSGPAAGKTTVPNTAAEKTTSNMSGNTAAGAPGVKGKSGSESGHAPSGSAGHGTNH